MRIETVAAKQFGLFTLQQAVACGVAASTLARRHAEGALERPYRAVYRFAGSARHPHDYILAAILRAGPGTYAAACTALYVHGLLEHRPDRLALTSSRRVTIAGVDIIRTDLHPGEQRHIGPTPTAALERALVQAAATLPEDPLHQVVADAVRTGRTTLTRVARTLDATPTRRAAGAAALRRIVHGGLGYSHPERLLLRILRHAGITGFIPNMVFVGPSGRRWILDAADPELRLSLEAESWLYHTSPARQQNDIDKSNDLAAAGWDRIRLSATDILTRPDKVVAIVQTGITTARRRHPD